MLATDDYDPFALETCDGIDDDCDAGVDESPAAEMCLPAGGREQACRAGACRPILCAPGTSDCNGADDGCETLGPCTSCPGGCAEDEDCVTGACLPCVPRVVRIPGASAPPRPGGLNVRCFDGPSSFVDSDCPVIECGTLQSWPFSYFDNRFSLGVTTYTSAGTLLRTTELVGTRYVYAAAADAMSETVELRGQDDATVTAPWTTFRNP
ncbi:MAG: hypothetical protein ACK6CU_31865 [Deltaproteobacteria bacterium]|jgi:hypothetical protein